MDLFFFARRLDDKLPKSRVECCSICVRERGKILKKQSLVIVVMFFKGLLGKLEKLYSKP